MSTIKTTTLSTQGGSTVPVDTVVNGTAKAWVNFNGTGTVAIRRAFNVSSITDNGTGDYTVNFTTAMPDTDYATIVSGDSYNAYTSIGYATVNSANQNVAFTRFRTLVAGSAYDKPMYTLAIFS